MTAPHPRASVPLCWLVLATPLIAQDTTAALEGQVVDSVSDQAVAHALVRIDSGEETVSDRDGRFRLVGLEPGSHVVAALTADCRVAWTAVGLASQTTSSVRISLPPPPAGAEGARADAGRARPSRYRVTSAEIDAMHAVTLQEVVRRVAPNLFPRGRNSLVSPAAQVVVVIDGVRAADGGRALDVLRPSDVRTLEVAPGAAGGWEFGSAGSAGVIRITTGREAVGGHQDNCQATGFPGR